VIVQNATDASTVVDLSIGSDSVVQPSSWPFCGVDAGLVCSFTLAPSSSQSLPTGGSYLNVSVAFNGPVGCGLDGGQGSTLGEVTANNTNGYGTADVSLVNGYSNEVEILISPGPDGGTWTLVPAADGGNTQALGVYPFGCDICVARQAPTPCGIASCGSSPDDGGQGCGCKLGGQYAPAVPCQITYQQADAGSIVVVALVP
jgi:hypothetical protein